VAVIAAFQLATAPNQPQSQGVPVPNSLRSPPVPRLSNTVITLNKFFRPPDPGVGHAY
jgi:hypothetical protein